MSNTIGGTDVIGGGGYGFGGGFGGIAPFGLFGLIGGLGRDGFGRDGHNGMELGRDIQSVSTEVHKLGNELQNSIFNLNNGLMSEFRNIDNQVCDVEKTLLQQSYAQSLQAFQNTQAIQNQMSNFQHATDRQFCDISRQINADGDATRALITQNLIDGLRSELAGERRGRDNREIEINVSQNVNQLQQQQQAQFNHLAGMMSDFSQNLRATQSVVNFGNGNARAGQNSTNNQVG